MLCLWPFRHVSIDSNGHFRPCCSWRHEDWKISYPNVDIVDFNINSIADYIDSKFINSIQSMMKNDQYPLGGCSDCINEIKTGRIDNALSTYGFQKYNMGNKFKIHDMEIKFGNKCNLGCVMCAPACSSLLESEAIEHFETIESYGFAGKKEKLFEHNTPWFEREDKMQELALFASQSRLIRFTGGEPTVNGYLRKFLSFLKQYTTDIELKLTTNGFKIPDSLLDIVCDFKSVWFDFSIDGVGKVNEFVRWPSKWDSIVSNIEKCNTLPNAKVTVKTTLHAMNVHNIGEICAWVKSNDHISEWDINLVWEPLYLRPSMASESSKQHYRKQAQKYQNDWKCQTVTSGLNALENTFSPIQSKEHTEKLDKYLTMLSSIRGINWKEYIKV